MSTNLNGNAHQPKRTRTARAAAETIKQASPEDSAKMSALNRFLQAQEDMLREWGAPSAKRAMIGFTTSLIVACGIGFLGGILIEALVMATITLTGSALLAFIIWALGVACMVVGGSIAAANTYAYIVSRKVDAHLDQARGWINTTKASVLAAMQRDPKPETMVH